MDGLRTRRSKIVKIIQGGAKIFTVRLDDEKQDQPFDFTGVVQITTCFFNTDTTELMLTLSGSPGGIAIVGDPKIGKLQISISSTQAALLQESEDQPQTLELSVDFGTGPQKFQIPNAYIVKATVC
jgi:hypothetical protein